MIEGHREDARTAGQQEGAGGLLDPLPLDEAEQRLPGDGPKHPVEVKRREGGHPGQLGQGQGLGEMLADVIDDPVDPLLILEPAVAAHRFDVGEATVRYGCRA